MLSSISVQLAEQSARIRRGPDVPAPFNMVEGDYLGHYKQSRYYPVWQNVLRYIRMCPDPKILEIGCGTGQLAHYLYDEGFRNYQGFDIDEDSLEVAKRNSPQYFFKGQAEDIKHYNGDYNIVIATEVFEHLKDDVAVIRNIRKDANLIFSLPTFMCPGHLRCFKNAMEITNRYFDCLYIKELRLLKNKKWFIGWGKIR